MTATHDAERNELVHRLDGLVAALKDEQGVGRNDARLSLAVEVAESLGRLQQEVAPEEGDGWQVTVFEVEGNTQVLAWRREPPVSVTLSAGPDPLLIVRLDDGVWMLDRQAGRPLWASGDEVVELADGVAREAKTLLRSKAGDSDASYERWQEQHTDPRSWRCDTCGLVTDAPGPACRFCSAPRPADAAPFVPGRVYEVPSDLAGVPGRVDLASATPELPDRPVDVANLRDYLGQLQRLAQSWDPVVDLVQHFADASERPRCPRCGERTTEGRFCPHCGAPLDGSARRPSSPC